MRPIIYHPSGRAGEYANKGYAVNLFRGCTHGCLYCFSPSVMRMTREQFHAAVITAPDVLERLKADMKRIGKVDEPIFLCFTCDPYCKDADIQITRSAIEIIMESGNTVNILTKAGLRAARDFDLLSKSPENRIGTTLTFFHHNKARQWEPDVTSPMDRVNMLEHAKAVGIKTWASIEPVIIPEESLAIMEEAIPYVDEFKIGKWNHDKRANDIDWKRFANDAIDLMTKHDKKYALKEDLARYL